MNSKKFGIFKNVFKNGKRLSVRKTQPQEETEEAFQREMLRYGSGQKHRQF